MESCTATAQLAHDFANPLPNRYASTLRENGTPANRVTEKLTISLLSTCYDHQLRSDKRAFTDLKPAIDFLRSLGDILHNLHK